MYAGDEIGKEWSWREVCYGFGKGMKAFQRLRNLKVKEWNIIIGSTYKKN